MRLLPSTVAIIGAGPGGLIAAKTMHEAGLQVTVFEAAASPGGIWRRGGRIVYKNLRCNLPHQIMAFKDVPFDADKSFISTNDVTRYLETFASDIRVRYSEPVLKATKEKKWRIRTGRTDELFDFVVVANGHYDKPASFDLNFPNLIHSKDYWDARDFLNQTVLCVGARSSGTDIAKELVDAGCEVFVADKAQDRMVRHGRLVHAPAVESACDGRVSFVDGSVARIDTVIMCHGFDYDFPFLKCVDVKDRVVSPLFRHLFLADDPTVCFLGIPHSVSPFPLMQIQALLASRVYLGLVALPCVDDMRRDERRYKAALKRDKDAHHLGDAQWAYCKDLLALAQIDDPSWTTFLDVNRQIYDHVKPRRPKIPGAPDTYRDLEYHVDRNAGTWTCLNEADVDARLNLLLVR